MKRLPLVVFAALLVVIGLGAVLYKVKVLGFPLYPETDSSVWRIEASLDVLAHEPKMDIRLNRPDTSNGFFISASAMAAPGFEYQSTRVDGLEVLRLTGEVETGRHPILLRYDAWFADDYALDEGVIVETPPDWNEQDKQLASNLVGELAKANPTQDEFVRAVLQLIFVADDSLIRPLFEQSYAGMSERMNVAVALLKLNDIQAGKVRGLQLRNAQSFAYVNWYLVVSRDGGVDAVNPRNLELIPDDHLIVVAKGDELISEVYGGEIKGMSFATHHEVRPVSESAVEASQRDKAVLVDFSIYSLPISQQATFKQLLLIPLGALVVVVLRNLVGLRTSGTFMPVLIAMVFLQTSLITGIGLFLIVVSVGLILRALLSGLNLLLVPRIASVLVFVIMIFAGIGVASHKLGIESGLQVTFFPMIILSWTIERMSVLWEEEGPKEVLVQGSGSLITASFAFLLMSQQLLADFIFLFPEVLFVLLAVIVMIGSYSGYRLSDLRRFEPMVRHQEKN